MKNFFKLFGIIALVVIIGFSMTACGDSGGDGGGNDGIPTAGDGFIDFSSPIPYTVANGDNTARAYDKGVSFFMDKSFDLADVFAPGTYKVETDASNKFILQLGIPEAMKCYSLTDIGVGAGVEFPASLQIFELSGFRAGSKTNAIYWEHDTNQDSVSFIYASQNGTVVGKDTNFAGGYGLTLSLELKQGWNTVICTETNMFTLVTGTPSNSYKWRIGSDS